MVKGSSSRADRFHTGGRLRVSSKKKLLSLLSTSKPRSSRGKTARSTNGYNVLSTYTIRIACGEVCARENAGWGGYGHDRISLPPSGRRRGPASRLLTCSGLSRCSCLPLSLRSNPFGLPDWSPLRIGYTRKGQMPDVYSGRRLLTGCVWHRKVEFHLIFIKVVLDRGQRGERSLHSRR